jgi:hypothetical protein
MKPNEALNKHFEDIEKEIKRNERMLKNIDSKYWEKVRSKAFNTLNEAEKKVIDYMYRLGYSAKNYEIEKRGEGYVITFDSYVENANNLSDGGYMAHGGEVDKELIDVSAKSIYDKKGMMGLRNTFLQAAKADEYSGDKETAEYRRKVVSEYQSNQPKFMANGGMMAKGGEGGELSKSDFLAKTIVYDNGGESFDRYTVFTPDGSVYAMSETAQGFNQYIGESDEIPKGSHLGKKLKSVPKDIEWAVSGRMEYKDGGMMAKGGRLLSAINRDRAYKSEQEWEKDYKRKTRPKNPKYKTSYEMGGQAPVKKYPMLSNMKTDLIN